MALPVKKITMTPSMSSKKIAALKIKHKVLNSSSFFKVSLKSNNKELAVALQLEKERSRQLQKDIVYFQKQAESLCFELCSKNYKHKKLLLIMQNLRSNTVQHFDMVAELCSDSDLTILSEEVNTLSGDNNKENLVVGSLTDQLPPPRPKTSEAFLCPVQKVTADLPEKNTCGNILQGADINNDNTNVEKRQVSSQCFQAPQTGRPRPSISFWDEVRRLSTNLSQSAFDRKSILPNPLLNSQQPPAASVVSACKEPQPSLSEVVEETEPKHSNRQEKTVLLNTTMDMTLCTSSAIVTVETKARKPKSKKTKKEQASSVSNVAENPQVEIEAVSELREVQIATTAAPLLQTDHHVPESTREPEVTELPSPTTQFKSVATSRIPKLTKPNAGNRTKTLKERRKSAKHKSPSNDIVHPALDDYFTDPKIRHSKASESAPVPSEEDTSAEQPSSRITFRRSTARSRRMTSGVRKIFNVSPSHEIENGTSELEQVCNEAEVNHESPEEIEMPEEQPFCAEEIAIPEFSSANKKAQRKTMQTAAKSVGNTPKSRSRGFVKSASKMASAVEVGAASQDINPYSIGEVQEEQSTTVTDATSEVRLHSGSSPHRPCDEAFVEEVKTPSSCKRPRVATLDSEIPQEHLRSVESDDHAALPPPPPPLDQEDTSDTEFQKPKKARRDETGRSSKKKSAPREECGDRVNEGETQRKKKKKKKNKTGSHSNKDSRTELEACHHEEPSDALSRHVPNHDPGRIEKQTDDLQVFGLNAELDGERADIFDEPFNSESGRESNVTRRKTGKTPKPHTPAETTRNQRETFVVYEGTPPDKPHTLTETSMNLRETYFVYEGTSPDTVSRMPSLSQAAYSQIVDTVDGNAGRGELGECLTDEMPPWLGVDVDVSTADTELGSVLATPRRETAHRKAVIRESPEAAADASPAGRVLTSLTNTIPTPDTETKGRSRRRNGAVVSYKEPKLNSKIRRGDKNTDCTFLSSPVFKDGKKKNKKNKTATNTKMEISLEF